MAGDITIAQTTGADTAAYSYMLGSPVVMQDITPASIRRSDGDTRYQTLQTEGFWSQSDWSNGAGVREQKDPASFFYGIADTSFPGQITCPQDFQTALVATSCPEAFCEHGDTLYAVFKADGSSTRTIYYRGTSSWTTTGLTVTNAVTSMVSHRDKIYLGFGSTAVVQRFNVAATTLTAETFYAQVMESYGSMLHYIWYDSTGPVWRLSRWDVDNSNALNVGAFSLAVTSQTFLPGAMRAAYGYLFITFPDTLWSYKTENGNTGILVGPLDRWPATPHSGQTLEAHDGAMVYGAGGIIRRYPPNGAPRTLYPTPPRVRDTAYPFGEVVGMRSVASRLYVLTTAITTLNGITVPTGSIVSPTLWCWNGTGMHAIAHYTTSTVASPATAIPKWLFVYDRKCSLYSGFALASTLVTAGRNCDFVPIPIITGNIVADQSLLSVSPSFVYGELETGKLDMGLADVIKTIRRWRYRMGTGGTVSVQVITEGGTSTALTTSGLTERTPVDQQDQVFKELMVSGDGTLSSKWFKFRIALTPTNSTTTPVFTALTCIPNPAMPLRKGFKIAILIGQHIQDYTGTFLYPTASDVTTALARVMALRAKGDTTDPATNGPLTLVWVDGTTYKVRANTIVVSRVRQNPIDAPYWQVILDMQEVV